MEKGLEELEIGGSVETIQTIALLSARILRIVQKSCEDKTWTREDNQLALHWYFRTNPTPRGYRKMIEILQQCASFQTSQRLADQVRTMVKKGWFSDLEILEIHQKINNQQDSNTVPDTSNINKKKSIQPKLTANFTK